MDRGTKRDRNNRDESDKEKSEETNVSKEEEDERVVVCAYCEKEKDPIKKLKENLNATNVSENDDEEDSSSESGSEWTEHQVFETPWSSTSVTRHLCGDRCHENFFESDWDFCYQYCESCDRYVRSRNANNGYDTFFVTAETSNDWERICKACYEDNLLEHGQPKSDFEGKNAYKIGGGSFFSVTQLKEHGYKKHGDNYFISCGNDASKINEEALSLINKKKKVLIDFRSIAITGTEGYVSLFVAHCSK